MSNPFIGEVRMFAGNFNPRGWAFCQGQLLPIAQNDTLYALIGTTFGGDGQVTFGLPDMQGRIPVGQGQGPSLSSYTLGQESGAETVTLTTATMPTHNHVMFASTTKGDQPAPVTTSIPAQPDAGNNVSTATFYVLPTPNPLTPSQMAATTIGAQGGNQPHDNIMPSLVLNYIIALEGVFPSRN
ncbi:MAG: Tail Collar domain protein [Sphingomonas bacterium]|uniref:phage tail protein n=1 Tax=Sphingomonas bacterium TaxID=1895847 RepID=UPI002A5BC896|nr:Tail Collar domain protein [Sphingomonas bacterium]